MMRSHHAVLLACASAAVALAPGRAAAAPGRVEPVTTAPPATRPAFVLETGYDRGSTDLLTVELTDGSSQTLSANGGFWMSAGAAFLRLPVGSAGVDTVATLGFKYDSIGAKNGSFRYLAFPIELYERISYKQARLAAGLSLALAPSLAGSGVLSEVDVDLKRSLGFVFRADWIGNRSVAQRGWFLGARFLWQKLEPKTGGTPVGANAFGVALGAEL